MVMTARMNLSGGDDVAEGVVKAGGGQIILADEELQEAHIEPVAVHH